MQLGFVTAILPELSLLEVAQFAKSAGYSCIEVMVKNGNDINIMEKNIIACNNPQILKELLSIIN